MFVFYENGKKSDCARSLQLRLDENRFYTQVNAFYTQSKYTRSTCHLCTFATNNYLQQILSVIMLVHYSISHPLIIRPSGVTEWIAPPLPPLEFFTCGGLITVSYGDITLENRLKLDESLNIIYHAISSNT